MRKSTTGFTIVELLIVIVVIAILAAISIVAYTGIQQRANNTKTIAAANQVVKAISGYIAVNGSYPYTGTSCVVPTSLSTCTAVSTDRETNPTLVANLQTISSLPSTPVAVARDSYDGIVYWYYSTRTVAGNQQPVVVSYSLNGYQQPCGLANVITSADHPASVWSTTGYTSSSGSYTTCWVSVPGPGV